MEDQSVAHVERRFCIRPGPQSGLGCVNLLATVWDGTSIARKDNAQRTIMIWKTLQEFQRNAELASGALVSSAAISRAKGSRVMPQIPINPQRTNRAIVLSGRTVSKDN